MAQYNKQNNSFLANGTSLFEVVMLADAEGNINSGGGNFSGTAVDAFGRARMSQPLTIFDSNNVGRADLKFASKTEGSANVVYNVDSNHIELLVASAGDSVIYRSKRRGVYQPGKSLLVMSSFCFNPILAGVTQKVGYYDNQDGIYFEHNEDGQMYIVLRDGTVGAGSFEETRIPQSDWNGDKLNGVAGDSTSGFILDPAMTNIFFTDIEWLGVGSVRVGFVINGQLIVCHTFHNANNGKTRPYMASANLPITYEISATQQTSAVLRVICSTIISEGGYEAIGVERTIGTPLAGNSTNTANTFVNLVSVKLNDPKDIAVLSSIDILNIANTDFEWGLFKNATIAGLTYSVAEGSLRYDLTGNDLTALGTRIAGGYLGGKTAPVSLGDLNWDYQLGTDVDLVSDTFTIAVRATTTSKAAAGLLKWFDFTSN
jgi:hypothetical protein